MKCTFCKKDVDSVKYLIQKEDALICNECVEACVYTIEKEKLKECRLCNIIKNMNYCPDCGKRLRRPK
jgi:ATP-dependent protease Clp ATPase subunit